MSSSESVTFCVRCGAGLPAFADQAQQAARQVECDKAYCRGTYHPSAGCLRQYCRHAIVQEMGREGAPLPRTGLNLPGVA